MLPLHNILISPSDNWQLLCLLLLSDLAAGLISKPVTAVPSSGRNGTLQMFAENYVDSFCFLQHTPVSAPTLQVVLIYF